MFSWEVWEVHDNFYFFSVFYVPLYFWVDGSFEGVFLFLFDAVIDEEVVESVFIPFGVVE